MIAYSTRIAADFLRLFACVFLAIGYQAAFAEDWPHWMGPQRDNTWQAKNILEKFPQGGPRIVWKTKVAGGYAGPAVVGNRLYISDYATSADVKIDNFDRKESTGMERVMCLDASTGNELWKQEYPVKYSISYPAGPRCTPVVEGGRVTCLGAEGNLLCCDAQTGAILWSKNLKEEYKTKAALWGYASHPLVDGNNLICVVGGEGSHTVAFDKISGKELWRYGTATEQGYSPPTIIQAGGKRQLILMSPNWIASVDPENGHEYWTEKFGVTNGAIIMTPIQVGKYLYVGGYENRSLMLELKPDSPGAKTMWRDKPKSGISPVNVQPFLDGDLLYGMDGAGRLMAVQVPEGNRLWESGQPLGARPVATGTAFIVKQSDRYFLFAETGDLVIGKLSPAGFTEIDRAKVIEPSNNAFGRQVVWCAPAFANGRMYVRNDEICQCVDLSNVQ